MYIRKIAVENFKSFRALEFSINNLNVLIGPNASGKSNFVQIFRFLRDLERDGLNNAISLQGGIEYLGNVNMAPNELFSFKIFGEYEHSVVLTKLDDNSTLVANISEAVYQFGLSFRKSFRDYDIQEDKLTIKCNFLKFNNGSNHKTSSSQVICPGEIRITSVNGKIDVSTEAFIELPKIDLIYLMGTEFQRLPRKTLIMETPIYLHLVPRGKNIYTSIAIHDFDPNLPKKAVPISGKAELEEDASNLPIAIKNITEDMNMKRRFYNIIKHYLPFIDNISVENLADKSLLFKIKESYGKKSYYPASLMSNGTINIISMIVALYFQDKSMIVIEEPEKNIHPHLISRVADMLEEVSKDKQIIITTHSPHVLRHVNINNISSIYRDRSGASRIIKPAEKAQVIKFMENDIGIDELFVQNLLGE